MKNKILRFAIIILLIYFTTDAWLEYLSYNEKYIKVNEEIVMEKRKIESLKKIELQKYSPVGISANEYSNKNPLVKFESVNFLSHNRSSKTIKSFKNKIYREVTTKLEFQCTFPDFINILNFLKNNKFLFKVFRIEFDKINNDEIKCYLEFMTIVFFNIT